jgi:hypothetical protein
VLGAGVAATVGGRGVIVASALLAVATVVAAGGFAVARDPSRRVNIGILIPIVAALPLFGIFYAIGMFIFSHLGQAIGAGLLFACAAGVAAVTGATSIRRRKAAHHHS